MPASTSSLALAPPSVWSMSTVQPRARRRARRGRASSAKYGTSSSGTARAMMPVRPRRRLRAERFGR